MGTNYYLQSKPPCRCCGRSYENESRHIGKSSYGWAFSLHVYPDDGINDLPDWEKLIRADGAVILDEYGCVVSANDMMATITERGMSNTLVYFDYDGNYGVPGPKNLVRFKVDGKHCIKHGAGTWDCCVGDFS